MGYTAYERETTIIGNDEDRVSFLSKKKRKGNPMLRGNTRTIENVKQSI
jgi:hypothetical protein